MSPPADPLALPALRHGNARARETHAVPVVDAGTLHGDPRAFHGRHAATPVIVRGVYPPSHPLARLDLDQAAALLGDVPVQVYDGETQDSLEVQASALFADMKAGVVRYNVVDHTLVGTAFGAIFEAPDFFGQNWFLGPPAHLDRMARSLVLTAAGTFTPLHLDAYGMQGWMYLVTGRKLWELYPPSEALSLWDPLAKTFYDPTKHRPEAFPALAHAARWVGAAAAGDLMYVPAGWVHQVETTEASLGVGGSVLNDHQIVEHVRCWLWERTMDLQGPLDLEKLLLELPRDRYADDLGWARGREALELCR